MGRLAANPVLVRERIDWQEDGVRHSAIHRVWAPFMWLPEEFYRLELQQLGGRVSHRQIAKDEWDSLAANQAPVSVVENSDWGSGLPGAVPYGEDGNG